MQQIKADAFFDEEMRDIRNGSNELTISVDDDITVGRANGTAVSSYGMTVLFTEHRVRAEFCNRSYETTDVEIDAVYVTGDGGEEYEVSLTTDAREELTELITKLLP